MKVATSVAAEIEQRGFCLVDDVVPAWMLAEFRRGQAPALLLWVLDVTVTALAAPLRFEHAHAHHVVPRAFVEVLVAQQAFLLKAESRPRSS
jgi:hypothetical protein